MEALGREFNLVPTADAVEINCRDCSGVTFVGVGTDTYTVEEATTAAGAGAQSLAVITRYFRNASAVGAAAWTLVEQSAAATASAVSSGLCVIEISTKSLSDGFDYVRCSSAGAGLVIAIAHGLTVQRDPVNLPALAV